MTAGEEKIEGIRASDLMKLMKVVQHATGLYNALEKDEILSPMAHTWWHAFVELRQALRDLGLAEVEP